jgi:hypothetical protein
MTPLSYSQMLTTVAPAQSRELLDAKYGVRYNSIMEFPIGASENLGRKYALSIPEFGDWSKLSVRTMRRQQITFQSNQRNPRDDDDFSAAFFNFVLRSPSLCRLPAGAALGVFPTTAPEMAHASTPLGWLEAFAALPNDVLRFG